MSEEKISLLVLAAGMGSRYGGLKQLDELGPGGETILEYSIYDAIQAGFGKVVFVVRDFFQEEFADKITSKFENAIDVHFVCQEVNPAIPGFTDLPEREKPWGTSHAVLVAKDVIHEPFAVINADDYYGKDSFAIIARFLREEAAPDRFGMVGYILENTLSSQGHVNRGVCSANAEGDLTEIEEILKIRKDAQGHIVYGEAGEGTLSSEVPVSMNFWGFHQDLFPRLQAGFHRFVRSNQTNPKAEYFIPLIIDELIKAGDVKVKLLTSKDQWYGVTYKEDADRVKAAFQRFANQGIYPSPLWNQGE